MASAAATDIKQTMRELIDVTDKIKQAEEQVKELKQRRDLLDEQVREHLVDLGMDKATVDGRTLAIRRRIFAKHLGDKQSTIDAMRGVDDMRDLIEETVNGNRLNSIVAEMIADVEPGHEDDAIPEPLRGILGWSDKFSVSVYSR